MPNVKKSSFLFLMAISSVLYVYGLPFQPVYIISILFLIFLIKDFLTAHFNISIQSIFLFILFYVFANIALQMYFSAPLGGVVNYSMCWLLVIVGFHLSRGIKEYEIQDIINKVAWGAVVYSLVDALWRFKHPNMDQVFDGNPFFYQYKDNSLMFEDSNFVGLMLVCINGIMFAGADFYKRANKVLVLMIFIATIFTFSRGSIIAVLFTYLLWFFFNSKVFFKFLILICLTVTISIIISFLLEDGSFRSKFFILELFEQHYNDLDLINKLLGVGLGNTVNYLGIGAHNIIVVGGFELGIIGSLAFLYFLYAFYMIIGRPALYMILPYFLNGFSLTSTSVPILFLFFGVFMCVQLFNRSDILKYRYINR